MTDPGVALLVFAVLAAGAGAVLWLQQRIWPALKRRSGRFEQVEGLCNQPADGGGVVISGEKGGYTFSLSSQGFEISP